jgi:hypothetical protein
VAPPQQLPIFPFASPRPVFKNPLVQTVERENHLRDKYSHEFHEVSRILAGFHAESDPTVEFLREISAIRGKVLPPSLHMACGCFQCLNRSQKSLTLETQPFK